MAASPAQNASDRPRFRQDLVAEPVEDGATRFIDVADPDTGNLFRFYEVEYSLACAMDGDRDVNGIVQWAKEELGLQASAKEVQLVISTLRDLGYLESGAAAAAAARPAAAAPVETPRPAAAPQGVKPAAKPSVNKWDQPTSMGDPDEYLEPGVVAAKSSRAPAADDVELGSAGAHAPKVETDLPKAADLELGAPGATAAPSGRPPVPKTADIPHGCAGKSDVSIDLADHMAVGADDVKEAVRASQVLKAVDVPKELLDSVEPTVTTSLEPKKQLSKDEQRAAEKAARIEKQRAEAAKAATVPVAESKPEPKVEKKQEPPADKKPEPKVEKKPEPSAPRAEAKAKPAVDAPKKQPVEEKHPVAPPAPSGGTSGLLIALLVIAILFGLVELG